MITCGGCMTTDSRHWVQLRNARNKLQAEFNPQALKLVICDRGECTEYDLTKYLSQITQKGDCKTQDIVLQFS